MSKITKWIESCIFNGAGTSNCSNGHVRLDTMQVEAIQKLKEGRQFMTDAVQAISAKYQNEKAG